MLRLLMIADDFTGALDTGVQLARHGARTLVVTDAGADLRGIDTDVEVLVMDAETRHLPSLQAHEIVARIVAQGVERNIPYIYKKTDSALRGNIGAELSAALEASGARQLFFFPALPGMNRQTVDGVHYIDGVPVAQSVFGADPFEPVTESRVTELIAQKSDVPAHSFPPLETAGPLPSQEGILIFDAQTEMQLRTAGQRLLDAGRLKVMAGCAGFAAVLPDLLKLGDGHPPALPLLDKRLLVLCGSVNPITLTQLDAAERAGFTHLRMTAEQKLEPDYWDTEPGRLQLEEWARIMATGGHCILDSNGVDGSAATDAYAARHGWSCCDIRTRVSRSLGRVLKKLGEVEGTLLITGGDTLLQCMHQIGVTELQPLGELASGVVLSRFVLDGSPRFVISKSGGFGPPDLLLHLTDFLAAQR